MMKQYMNSSFSLRFVALLIDWLFSFILGSISFSIVFPNNNYFEVLFNPELLMQINRDPNYNLMQFYSFIIGFFYTIVLAYFLNGATLGKKIVGIRIVTVDGERISFWRLVFREYICFSLLGGLTCGILLIVSFFRVIFSIDQRAIHDLIASTKVVNLHYPITYPVNSHYNNDIIKPMD